MFFQINVTPKEKKPLKVSNENGEEEQRLEELFELVLAPFQPQPRVKLTAKVYNSVKCSLTVRNPSNRNLNVTISKMPPPERSLILGASELTVQAESSAELEISWTPQESGSWRDILQLTDSRRIKYDVALLTTAQGVKKPVKGRSRILGPANTNGNPGARKISPPVAREAKKTISTHNLQNVPNKRPRLNVQPANKENVSKSVWNHRPIASKKAHNSHDFSAIINSTNFNLTPLKSKPPEIPPEIQVTDFSPHEIGIVSPEATLPNLRRETYVADKTKHPENHEFSLIMNSTNFKFTPLKSGIREKQPEVRSSRETFDFPAQIGILSPEKGDLPILRRETYVATKNGESMPINRGVMLEEDENEENFEDSLSPLPQDQIIEPKASELLESNFMTPKTQEFSPNGCSTGNRTKSIVGQSNHENSSLNLAGNDTFDISESKNNSVANGTYELSKSPKSAKTQDSIKPTRLSKSFGNSEIELSKNPVFSSSSTPLCSVPKRGEYLTRNSTSRFQNDDVSAKDVLEADLWVKSHQETTINTFRGKCISLDRINEEQSNPSMFPILNRTKTLPIDRETPKGRRLEISPPMRKKHVDSMRHVSPTKSVKIRKDKSIDPKTNLRKRMQMNCSLKRGNVSTIPGVRITNLSLAGFTLPKSVKTERKEISVKLHDPNDFLTRFCNPDPFGATMTQDPFLTSTLYYDEKWIHHQEMEFKKWLNALMTSPEHLSTNVDTLRIDVGKVWQSCRNREDVALAESRESVSARYHTNTRLNTLRKAACVMFRRGEVTAALSKTAVCVERGIHMIRQDRDLHRDIGLQKEILELFLSYNPLWLRIGLETIYGETIPLNSNNDLVGLTRFIIQRFFSDPHIVKTHSHVSTTSIKLATFANHMNKFILKKFLFFVYFLDHAKRNKLIGHDPCLFHKLAPHKESRDILLTFSRQVLSGVGDLTKVLRSHGYVVAHKQTYLDEYDYAVNDIATDLRDGVRLCRVMELISGDRDLTTRCRVPAISRLQKIHNVDVALTALLRCGYTLTGEIDAKSVADGHREKTLSLLWQIIYRYQAPRFAKAAISVQKWWRSKLWYVRVRNYLRNRRDNAAAVIQRSWRCFKARKEAKILRQERELLLARKKEAVGKIEIYWLATISMMRERSRFVLKKQAAICLQRFYRRRRETAPFVKQLRSKRRAIVTIQLYWRGFLAMKESRKNYQDILIAAAKIQDWWRSVLICKRAREKYLRIRGATLVLQSRWRAIRDGKIVRESFEKKISNARIIQYWWKRHLAFKRDRSHYLLMKNAVRVFENQWKARTTMIIEKNRFENVRLCVLRLQKNWRRYQNTKKDVEAFKRKQKASRIIQQWWRSQIIAKRYRISKNSCIIIQNWWRGIILTKSATKSFKEIREATIFLQKTRRMIVAMRNYRQIKIAVLRIESWYSEARISRSLRQDLATKKKAVREIQIWWRRLQICKKERADYLECKKSATILQTRWRALVLGKKARIDYSRTKKAIIRIQTIWRMSRQRRKYLEIRRRQEAAKILQKRWREILQGRKIRNNYVEYRKACILVQKRYRELRASRKIRADYLALRRSAIVLQKNWRKIRISRNYQKIINATIVLQRRFRARKRCLEARKNFLALKKATINMQNRFRAKKKAELGRKEYLKMRWAIIVVQNRFRANKLMKEMKNRFEIYRRGMILLQAKWRMLRERENYLKMRKSVLTIQIKWRARKIGMETRESYAKLRSSVLFVQRLYRANKLRDKDREEYVKIRERIIFVQRLWREKLVNRMREEAAIKIQTWWRSILEMRECKNRFESQKSAVIVLQKRFRAWKIAVKVREDYLRVLRCVLTIQLFWRKFIERRHYEEWIQDCKSAALIIESWWIIVMEKKREREAKEAQLRREIKAATTIQSAWRGFQIRRIDCSIMEGLRERLKRAGKAAVPSATVAFQLRQYMDMLPSCDTIGRLSMCLTNIDTLTRLSLAGCISFCELNLVDTIYETLGKSNRSIPWMDVCLRCTSILITLGKLKQTKKYVYRVEFIETLARLMTITIENHVDLFLHLATLLWLLSENAQYAEAITSCPRTCWLLSNLDVAVNKKKNRQSVNLNKSRMREQIAPLPNSKPDWGLKHKRPRLFTSVHHAMSSLIKRLKIDSAS